VEIVQTAMKEVDALKKKYAIVTNSNFKEEDVEKPVKHVQLQKRFFMAEIFNMPYFDKEPVYFVIRAGFNVMSNIGDSFRICPK
jgi:hypothetical protein